MSSKLITVRIKESLLRDLQESIDEFESNNELSISISDILRTGVRYFIDNKEPYTKQSHGNMLAAKAAAGVPQSVSKKTLAKDIKENEAPTSEPENANPLDSLTEEWRAEVLEMAVEFEKTNSDSIETVDHIELEEMINNVRSQSCFGRLEKSQVVGLQYHIKKIREGFTE